MASKKAKADIEIIEKKTDLLLIAPHGIDVRGKKNEDTNTAILTRKMAKMLKCSAIVNDKISRHELNFNSIKEATTHPSFLPAIQKVLDTGGSTLVVWVHGIGKDGMKDEKAEMNFQGRLDCLIGYGQPDKQSARPQFIAELIKVFDARSIVAHPTRDDADNYRGWGQNNMNQWFQQTEKYSSFDKVQSVQLEFSQYRRQKNVVKSTAKAVSDALSELVRPKQDADKPEKKAEIDANTKETTVSTPVQSGAQSQPTKDPDDVLVDDAVKHFKDVFYQHFQGAMLEAGQYLIEKFYGNDYDGIREGKRPQKKNALYRLTLRLAKFPESTPAKSWLYNAVRLAVDHHFFEKEGFSIYGKLGHSQKVLLTSISDFDQKKLLAEEIHNDPNHYTAARLRKRIKKMKGSKNLNEYYTPEKVPTKKILEQLPIKRLKKLKDGLTPRIKRTEDQLKQYQQGLSRVTKVLEAKPKKAPRLADKGFNEWTNSACNINISMGCENGCVYCYARQSAYRRDQVEKGRWGDQLIKMADVDKPRGWYYGLVGFPTTHDITEKNVEHYIYVLGKLLRAGNSVLIVSKPRIKCIKQICAACQFFKDKILFRFTIGAKDKKILKLWEPKAPSYEERVESLDFAKGQGFRTSVSIEPMLDVPDNTKTLVKDLLPSITEDIWLGKMNHLAQIEKNACDDLKKVDDFKKAIKIIKENQSVQKLIPIYKKYKNNPEKVKWKSGTREEIEEAIKTSASN